MPEERKTAKCTGCGAEIIWIEYLGKKHPVDAKPKRGFIFIEDEYGNDIGAVEMAAIRESHFATCPDAAKFRKKKAEKKDERPVCTTEKCDKNAVKAQRCKGTAKDVEECRYRTGVDSSGHDHAKGLDATKM